MAVRTFAAVFGLTEDSPLRTRDAVLSETTALRATSTSVIEVWFLGMAIKMSGQRPVHNTRATGSGSLQDTILFKPIHGIFYPGNVRHTIVDILRCEPSN